MDYKAERNKVDYSQELSSSGPTAVNNENLCLIDPLLFLTWTYAIQFKLRNVS
jgi:hypothetical protein